MKAEIADDGSRAVLISVAPHLVERCAELLAAQWPAQSASVRRAQLLAHCSAYARQPGPLPCNLLLIDGEAGAERLLGHCRLQQACDNADGFSAVVTSVIVAAEMRGQGYGRRLLQAAEEKAAAAGFAYMYLWTHDAQVSLLVPVLKLLDGEARGKLESMLAKRSETSAAAHGSGQAVESLVREDSVWMRRRLLEHCSGFEVLTREELLEKVHSAIAMRRHVCSSGGANAAGLSGDGSGEVCPGRHYEVQLASFNWERQCGPYCGLAALRMARSASPTTGSGDVGSKLLAHLLGETAASVELERRCGAEASLEASLLQVAISRGYSSDGEILDIHNLAHLAADVCGLHAAVVHDEAKPQVPLSNVDTGNGEGCLWQHVVARWLRHGGLAIVPYDRDERLFEPAKRGGHGAHYALLVGVASAQEASGHVLLLAVHGASRNPLVLAPSELRESNAQLREVKRVGNQASWIVGEAGMRLANRVLFVWFE
eukprot:gnl/TRDRNA2_/TRDRNA2_92564_c0_seq1.p1 gnl/TRDRNA2_/TRDRNA2_92564_c0~~gnl/TRDRNA2_/TRDRNA2_92564_c0_seq1.p1  ORF type:complete len:486 (+),score=80.22 gnl/TRDRNA2_/TRDRNA2_92564_c0_seq1:9-1466(+)